MRSQCSLWVAFALTLFSIQNCYGTVTTQHFTQTVVNSNTTATGLITDIFASGTTNISNGQPGPVSTITANYGSVYSSKPTTTASTAGNSSTFTYSTQVSVGSGMLTPTDYGVIYIGGFANGTTFGNIEERRSDPNDDNSPLVLDQLVDRLTLTNTLTSVQVNGVSVAATNFNDYRFSLSVDGLFLNLRVFVQQDQLDYLPNNGPSFHPDGFYEVSSNEVYAIEGDITERALYDVIPVQVSPAVPEPSSLVLLGFGGIGMAVSFYRRKRSA